MIHFGLDIAGRNNFANSHSLCTNSMFSDTDKAFLVLHANTWHEFKQDHYWHFSYLYDNRLIIKTKECVLGWNIDCFQWLKLFILNSLRSDFWGLNLRAFLPQSPQKIKIFNIIVFDFDTENILKYLITKYWFELLGNIEKRNYDEFRFEWTVTDHFDSVIVINYLRMIPLSGSNIIP